MSIRYATKSGNWSDVSVWDGGATKPGAGDTVVANGYTVTIDENATVTRIQTVAEGGGAAGGGFVLNNGITLTAQVQAGTTTCLTLATGASATIIGSVTGGSTSAARGLLLSSSGTITVVGDVTAGTSTTTHGAMIPTGTASAQITGLVRAGTSTGCGVSHGGTGTLTITGYVIGGSLGGAHGVSLSSASTAVITGTVTGGSASPAAGVQITGAATVTIVGDVTASGGNGVFADTTSHVRIDGSLIGCATGATPGRAAVSVPFLAAVSFLDEYTDYPEAGAVVPNFSGNLVRHYGLTSAGVPQAAPADVRSGRAYGPGDTLTGTLAVPPAASVGIGVPVDATVGTAAITDAAIRSAVGLAAANLDTQLAAIQAAVAGIDGDAPTAAEIADAVWDEAQAGHVVAGTFGRYLDAAVSGVAGEGLTVEEIAEGCWTYTIRTLTAPAVASDPDESTDTITRRRGDTWTITITGLGSLADRTDVILTIKAGQAAEDSGARLQVSETGGLVILNADGDVTAADASITVDDAVAGDITIVVASSVTAELAAPSTWAYDVQVLAPTNDRTPAEGTFVVTADVTRATS